MTNQPYAVTVVPNSAPVQTALVQTALNTCYYRVVASVTNAVAVSKDGMALIPAGTFTMGNCMDAAEGDAWELPTHEVHTSAFMMDRCEVSYALWQEVRTWAVTNGYTITTTGTAKANDYPVSMVFWVDATVWCNARSERDGLVPCYTNTNGSVVRSRTVYLGCDWNANGYRLPTEAEWERAARGSVGGHRFPWHESDEIQHARGNYWSTNSLAYDTSPTRGYHPVYGAASTPYSSPVGSFAPNDFGLYDMDGNVWEWCWDWFSASYYGTSPDMDPHGPATGMKRVCRGGNWERDAGWARVSHRSYEPSVYRLGTFGFRTCRTVKWTFPNNSGGGACKFLETNGVRL